ncbi:DUF6455 family protein [Pseudooceanicola sediminis]|nr:DUF6455 family protein [Pseudooceanicola sediminis]
MGLFRRLERHAALMDGMAERLGADVAGRIEQAPEAAGRAYRTAVLSCAACGSEEACVQWQADHDHADAAPAYCRNADWLEALRP